MYVLFDLAWIKKADRQAISMRLLIIEFDWATGQPDVFLLG